MNYYLHNSSSWQIFSEFHSEGSRAIQDDAWVEEVEHDPEADGEPQGEVEAWVDSDIEAFCFLSQKLNSFEFIAKVSKRCKKQKN
jgi:hypothetical protein